MPNPIIDNLLNEADNKIRNLRDIEVEIKKYIRQQLLTLIDNKYFLRLEFQIKDYRDNYYSHNWVNIKFYEDGKYYPELSMITIWNGRKSIDNKLLWDNKISFELGREGFISYKIKTDPTMLMPFGEITKVKFKNWADENGVCYYGRNN